MANNEVVLDGPIPGESLTAEPKSRPWRRPYQFSSIDEVVEYYIPQFSDETFVTLLTEQIENGVSLITIAEIMTSANAMEGKHSIDLAVLASPVLIEAMKYVADMAGVESVIGTESNLYRKVGNDSELVKRAVADLDDSPEDMLELEMMEQEEASSEVPEEAPATEKKGLMAPRSAV